MFFQYLSFSILLFVIGLWGVLLNKKNVLIIIMSIEIILLGSNLNFLIFSIYLDDIKGQVFALLILTVAAAESALGLSILIIFYQKYQTIDFDFIYGLHG